MRSSVRQRPGTWITGQRRGQHSTPEARAQRRQRAQARKAALPMAGTATLREPLLRPKTAPRKRLALWITGVLTLGTIFGMAVFHVVLIQSEFQLDKLTADAAEAQQHYEHLRLEVARLAAPERIVATAQQRLGMVIPPSVGYLTAPQPSAAENNDALSGSWSQVKPYLAGRP